MKNKIDGSGSNLDEGLEVFGK